MPNETDKTRSYLAGEREAVLIELQDRGCFEQFRSKEPELVDRYLKLSAAIVSYDAVAAVDPATEEYLHIDKPLDAVEAFLKKAGNPLDEEVIGKALEFGGWGRDRVDNPKWNIIFSIRNHLKPKRMLRKKVKRLKKINGLIGKIEWPDEMFAAIQKEKE